MAAEAGYVHSERLLVCVIYLSTTNSEEAAASLLKSFDANLKKMFFAVELSRQWKCQNVRQRPKSVLGSQWDNMGVYNVYILSSTLFCRAMTV